jgi:hypothetical protein
MTDAPLTLSVPLAGKRYFNLSRNGSYAAAERGEIPTIRIGRLLRVPVRQLGAITIYRKHNKPALGPPGDSTDDF